jgi:hypothetical protein
MLRKANTIDTFIMHAIDPQGQKLKYFWHMGEEIVGYDSIFFLTPEMKKNNSGGFALECHVLNNSSLEIIGWALLDTTMQFISLPPTAHCKRHSSYLYKAKAVSLVDEHPQYDIVYGPSWISIDRNGIVSGFSTDDVGDHTVIIHAKDKAGNYDYQTFTIHVSDSIDAGAKIITKPFSIQCFPNPLNEETHILFNCDEQSQISIEMADIAGVIVKKLIPPTQVLSGAHIFNWNGTGDDQRKLSAGIYLCKIRITTSGNNQTIIEKLVVL